MEWNYISREKSSTGYEDVEDILKSYNKEKYVTLSEKDKLEFIDEVCDIYIRKNIFPITYFSDDGVREEIRRCIEFNPEIKDGVLNTGTGVGTLMNNFLFPNLYETMNINNITKYFEDGENAIRRFQNRKFLRNAVKFAIEFSGGVPLPKNVMDGIRMGGATASNFRPMNAKALYERYVPVNGVVWDYCCGFGGRMLGCLTSKNNYTYIGTDPNTETQRNLKRLGEYIESVTGRTNSYRLLTCGSEELNVNPEIFDYAFSSPPYFNLEIYTDEKTQCYNRYPDIYDWIENYVKKTIEIIYKSLKGDRYYSVNIADFNYGSKRINYVDVWKQISLKCGFEFYEELRMRIPKRTHGGEKKKTKNTMKSECVMTFYKEK